MGLKLWVLARWFADQWTGDEAISATGLTTVSDAGGHLSSVLWNALGGALHSRRERPTWLNPWVALLVEEAPSSQADWLEYALVASRLPEDRHVALLLFDHLATPRLVPRPTFGLGSPAFEVDLQGSDYWLSEAWTKLFQPGLGTTAGDLLPMVDRHLRRARTLLVVAGSASDTWDPISFSRSSIAPHEQDRYGEKIGVLIDAARDCLEFIIGTEPQRAAGFIDSWSSSDTPILRRIAIHAVATDAAWTGDGKITWLLERCFLHDHLLKHEVFELLAVSLPSANDDVVERLVNEVVLDRGDRGDDVAAYETFNALVWIERYSSAPAASAALAKSRDEHPEFGVRDHPDFSTWSQTGFRRFQAPIPEDDFHELLHRDRSAALRTLEDVKGTRIPLDSPTWDDALELVQRVVAAHPDDGFVLLDGDPRPADDVTRAVIEGWAASTLADEVARRVIARLARLDFGSCGISIARLLRGSVGSESGTEWDGVAGARELARAVWRHLPEMPMPEHGGDWLQLAINDPGGHLAQFWLHAVSHDWNANEADWAGLDESTRPALNELLQRHDRHGGLAAVVLASQLHFIHAADRDWCLSNVMPLFDWSNPDRARRAWDGFLHWGRWTDQLLSDGLLPSYLRTLGHATDFEDELQRQLAQHLASVSLHSELDPATWTSEFTRLSPPSLRVEWINQISWMLGRLDDDLGTRQWASWMRGYWAGRIDSIPMQLTFEESGALAGWAVILKCPAEEAVGLALRTRAGLGSHGVVLHHLGEQMERAPAAYARLLAHLLAGTERPFWGCAEVRECLGKARGHAGEETERQIREQALRLGCADAAAW